MKMLLFIVLAIVGTQCFQKPFTNSAFEQCHEHQLQVNGCSPQTKPGARCYNFFKTFDYSKYESCQTYGVLYQNKASSNLALKGAKMYEECLYDITSSLAPSKYLDMFANIAQCVETSINDHFGDEAKQYSLQKAQQEDEYDFLFSGDGEHEHEGEDGEHDGEDGEHHTQGKFTLVQYFSLNALILALLFAVL